MKNYNQILDQLEESIINDTDLSIVTRGLRTETRYFEYENKECFFSMEYKYVIKGDSDKNELFVSVITDIEYEIDGKEISLNAGEFRRIAEAIESFIKDRI